MLTIESLRVYHPEHPNAYCGTLADFKRIAEVSPREPTRTSSEWTGASGIKEAREILKNESYPALLHELGTIPALYQNRPKKRITYAHEGDEIDLDRLYTGNAAYWMDAQPTPTRQRPRVTIECPLTENQNAHANIWYAKALAVMHLANALGEGTTIISTTLSADALEHTRNNSGDIYTTCVVKEATEPLNLNALSCILGLALFTRSTIFAVWATTPGITDSLGRAVAMSGEVTKNLIRVPSGLTTDNAVPWAKTAITKWEALL